MIGLLTLEQFGASDVRAMVSTSSLSLRLMLGIVKAYPRVCQRPPGLKYLALLYTPGHWPIKPGIKLPVEFA